MGLTGNQRSACTAADRIRFLNAAIDGFWGRWRDWGKVRNAFCATGEGGGVDPTCRKSSVTDRLIKGGMVDDVDLSGLRDDESSAVADAVEKSLNVGGRKLKLRSLKVKDVDPKRDMGFGYSNGHVTIARKSVESAREHDPEEVVKRYQNEPVGKRSFSVEDAKNSADYLALGVAHEIGHHVETALLLDTGKAAREHGSPNKDDILRVSGYATMHPVEAFAETHAMMSTGRADKVPDSMRKWYKASLATADQEGIKQFMR